MRHGCDTFFVAPGSRCGPLTTAVARHPDATIVRHTDERGLAFAALGHARARRTPAVILTTSGTAAANLYPAVIEAAMDEVPMIVITADRPPELRQASANQSIDQVKIYGDYTRWFADLPCPSPEIDPGFLLSSIGQAVRSAACGPVHLNCMLREPLAPDATGEDLSEYLQPLAAWLESDQPYTTIRVARAVLTDSQRSELLEQIHAGSRGIIIAGADSAGDDADALTTLGAALGWPVLDDITAGLRFTGAGSLAYGSPDRYFRSRSFSDSVSCDTVLHLGGRIVSKHVLELIQRQRLRRYIVVSSTRERLDPVHRVTMRVDVDSVSREVRALSSAARLVAAPDWRSLWKNARRVTSEALGRGVETQSELNEPAIAQELVSLTPSGWGLFVGNSMPVRDLDQFGQPRDADIIVAANRGASGIDGNLAAAFGFANGARRPVVALIGDLACMHDLNSLRLCAESGYPVIVVVVNNNGSAVFSFLPIAEHEDVFEENFATPHGLEFEAAAGMFGLSYECPSDMRGFGSCFNAALATGRSALIELKTERESNAQLHRQIYTAVDAALSDLVANSRT